MSIFAGNAGEFNKPNGLAVDRDDNVYVADNGNNKVKKVSPSGVISPFIDFTSPGSIAIGGDGSVYVSGPYQIRKIVDGVANPFAGSFPGDGDMFNMILCIAVDKNGAIYAADHDNGKIKKVTPLRVVSSIANILNVNGIAVDKNGDVFITLSMGGFIGKIVQE